MKSNELRIGNLAYSKKDESVVLVVTVYSKPDSVSYSYKEDVIMGHPLSILEPIPLTEEWLVKFGFEKKGINTPKWRFWKIDLVEDEKGIYSFDESRIYIDIEYVHQLQNLFYALTNEELTWN